MDAGYPQVEQLSLHRRPLAAARVVYSERLLHAQREAARARAWATPLRRLRRVGRGSG
jgi:hypothetical protein